MKVTNETYPEEAVLVWDVLSGVAKMAWDVMSRVTKMAWDVMSGVTKTAWDVLSGVANLCGMFCPGCKKMAWDVLSRDVLSGSRLCGSEESLVGSLHARKIHKTWLSNELHKRDTPPRQRAPQWRQNELP